MEENIADNVAAGGAAAAAVAQYAASASMIFGQKPSAWFTLIECVRNITMEEVKLDVIVSALPRASLWQVLNVIEHPHTTTPYTTLKNRLMSPTS
jgi:hypothetical protein